jgi:hypothetical protein
MEVVRDATLGGMKRAHEYKNFDYDKSRYL